MATDITFEIPWGVANGDPRLWDKVVLGGVEFPGLASVEITRKNKKDEKKAKGKNGHKRAKNGVESAEVKIRVRYMHAFEHDFVVSDCMPVIDPDPDKAAIDSITISHPVARARGVKAIMVDSVSGPTAGGGGLWEIAIDATEFREPTVKNATGSYKGASLSAKGSQCEQLADQYANCISEASRLQSEIAAKFAQGISANENPTANLGVGETVEGALAAEVAGLQKEQRGWYGQAQDIRQQMEALGCNKTKPSGAPGTTQP